MSRPKKTLEKVFSGRSDANIAFRDMCGMLKYLGFDCRINGSHRIFTHAELADVINLQPLNGKTKVFQVKQVRRLIIQHGLALNIFEGDSHDENPETEGE